MQSKHSLRRIATVAAVLGLTIVSGVAAAASTTGGSSCSVWHSMLEAMFGVHCGFF
jgi:hypothetical protein